MPETPTHQPSEIPSSKTSVLTRTFQAHQRAISHACLVAFTLNAATVFASTKNTISWKVVGNNLEKSLRFISERIFGIGDFKTSCPMTRTGSKWIETEHPYPLWSVVVAIHTCDCRVRLSIRVLHPCHPTGVSWPMGTHLKIHLEPKKSSFGAYVPFQKINFMVSYSSSFGGEAMEMIHWSHTCWHRYPRIELTHLHKFWDLLVMLGEATLEWNPSNDIQW